MQIDELRGELTTLADEIEPFAGNAAALHRRERRRHIVISSLVVALAVVVAASTAAVVHNHADDRVHVSGAGSKESSGLQMSHVDVIVTPVNDEVRAVLNSSPLVAGYAFVPHAFRGPRDSPVVLPADIRCVLERSDAFAVDASNPGPDFANVLKGALAGKATVYDVSDFLGSDIEVFMKLGTADARFKGITNRVASDPSVSSFELITHDQAYAIFKRDFADQPAIVASTKPSDLPASIQIRIKSGASVDALDQRYRSLAGVAMVIDHRLGVGSLFFTPAQFFGSGSQGKSACS